MGKSPVTSTAKRSPRFVKALRRGRWWLIFCFFLTILLIAFTLLAAQYVSDDEESVNLVSGLFLLPFVAAIYHRYKIAQDLREYVRIAPDQYPEVFAEVTKLCAAARLSYVPEVYLSMDPSVDPCTQNPGMRPFIVIGTDFLAGCRENSTPDALRFIVAHQIGHLVARHNSRRWIWFSAVGMEIPGLKTVLIKNLENIADIFAAELVPAGADQALALCAVGKDNYVYVNTAENIKGQPQLGIMSIATWLNASNVTAATRIELLRKQGLLHPQETEALPNHKELFLGR